MDIPVGVTRLLMVNFGSSKAGLATVGYALKNLDGTTTPDPAAPRTTTGVTDLGNGIYGVSYTPDAAGHIYIQWDTGETTPVYAYEDITILPATDLSSILAAITTMDSNVSEVVGLLGKNLGLKNAVYDGHNLSQYELFIYDTSAHALANDGVTGVTGHFQVFNTYNVSGDILTSRIAEL